MDAVPSANTWEATSFRCLGLIRWTYSINLGGATSNGFTNRGSRLQSDDPCLRLKKICQLEFWVAFFRSRWHKEDWFYGIHGQWWGSLIQRLLCIKVGSTVAVKCKHWCFFQNHKTKKNPYNITSLFPVSPNISFISQSSLSGHFHVSCPFLFSLSLLLHIPCIFDQSILLSCAWNTNIIQKERYLYQ